MTAVAEKPRGAITWRTRLAIGAGALVIRLLASTWRIRVVRGDIIPGLRARKTPILIVLWHGQMLPALWQHRGQGIAILISEHRDGEIITRIAQSLGLRAVRGSTSRGGTRALLEMARELSNGSECAVTPDGPRGPAREFAPGALVAAQRSGAAIVAIGSHASSAWRLRSWDRFMIPKPFARVTIAYRGPEFVADASPRAAAERAAQFGEMLNGAVKDAGGE